MIGPGNQKNEAYVIWFTGFSGAGKSTLGDRLFEHLKSGSHPVERLDGDIVRSIFPETGFSQEERNRHIKRVGYLASVLERNGVIVVASFVSPYEDARNFVRGHCENFIEVYLSASLAVCEKRDVKGLYEKARRGEIPNFTGINDPYEEPGDPELKIDTGELSVDQAFERVQAYLKENGYRA